ncbi:hypothetical protein B0H19DRAFT_1081125 [Mycena capillaripes]|nr:hypothetical protein B0H19DRAFT_1081125 [Mycena capillaripes]
MSSECEEIEARARSMNRGIGQPETLRLNANEQKGDLNGPDSSIARDRGGRIRRQDVGEVQAKLKSVLPFHQPLRDDEISTLNSVLELNTKNVGEIMTPMKPTSDYIHPPRVAGIMSGGLGAGRAAVGESAEPESAVSEMGSRISRGGGIYDRGQSGNETQRKWKEYDEQKSWTEGQQAGWVTREVRGRDVEYSEGERNDRRWEPCWPKSNSRRTQPSIEENGRVLLSQGISLAGKGSLIYFLRCRTVKGQAEEEGDGSGNIRQSDTRLRKWTNILGKCKTSSKSAVPDENKKKARPRERERRRRGRCGLPRLQARRSANLYTADVASVYKARGFRGPSSTSMARPPCGY